MWSLTDASPARLSEVAREIESSGKWTSFLTPQEHNIFVVALNHGLETWTKFLKGSIPCQLRFAGNDDENAIITDLDPVTLAFRVRYMLWESVIDDFSSPNSRRGSSSASVSSRAGSSSDGQADEGDNKETASDDDYDDYEDLENENKSDRPDTTVPEVLIAESKPEDTEPDSRGRSNAVMNSSKMYDTFELDMEQMKSFQRLKDSDEQIQRDSNVNDPMGNSNFTNSSDPGSKEATATNGSSLAAFAKTAQFGSANLCLKHLLTTIEAKRSELQVTDIELRNLISDVRKNRSKWASEERIGQEELYEASERVVQELRNTVEHSTAFLNKVSKREAPNYYDIIKNPMDLNTVMRKLRALQYNSKKEFVDDLNLIWSNCLTYNSDPSHFLRKHAIAMRQKTQALAPMIPDVTIRSRAEVEAEAELLEKKSREQLKRRGSDASATQGSKRKIGVTPAKFNINEGDDDEKSSPQPEDEPEKSNDNTNPQSSNEENPEKSQTEPYNEDEVNKYSKKSEEDDAEKTTTSTAPNDYITSTEEGTDADAEGIDSHESLEEDDEYRMPDVESSFWNSATRQRRIECIIGRKELFKEDKLQMDAPTSIRSPGSMLRFDKTIHGEDIAGQMAGISLLSTDSGEEPYMIEYEVNAGVPQPPNDDKSAWLKAPVPKLQDLAPSRYLSRGIVTDLMTRNLNEMQIIRRLCAKILHIKDLQSGQITYQHEMGSGIPGSMAGGAADYPSVKDPEEDISSRLPGAVQIDSRASYSSMKRVVAKLAMQAGFEAAQPRAIDTMASIAGEYLTKLGTTLVATLEAPDSSASFSSVIKGSLELMGVSRLNQLTKYIGDDVFRQGRRLSTFRTRLNSMLIEILCPEVEKYQDDQFQDNSEQFVLGQFSNELGDDYFGFKELGINEELGVASVAVPFHLLQQRMAYHDSGIPQGGARQQLGLDVPPYPPLTPEDIKQMQPFLRPAFEKILIKYRSVPTQQQRDEEDLDDKDSKDEQILNDPNTEHIANLALQASSARAKAPSSGKLIPRKKRFDRAYFVVKPESPRPESMTEGAEDHPEKQETPNIASFKNDNNNERELPDAGVDQDAEFSDPDVDAELNNEIGSLGFENEANNPSNGFSFDDSLPTGSLLLQADEDEDDDGGEGGEDLGFDFMGK